MWVAPAFLKKLEVEGSPSRLYTLTLSPIQMRDLGRFYRLLMEGSQKIPEGHMLDRSRFCWTPTGGPAAFDRMKRILGAPVETKMVNLGKLSRELPTNGLMPFNCASGILLALYYAGFEENTVRREYYRTEEQAASLPDPFAGPTQTVQGLLPLFVRAAHRAETVESIVQGYLKRGLHSFLRDAIGAERLRIEGVKREDQLTVLGTIIQGANPFISSDSFELSNMPDLGVKLDWGVQVCTSPAAIARPVVVSPFAEEKGHRDAAAKAKVAVVVPPAGRGCATAVVKRKTGAIAIADGAGRREIAVAGGRRWAKLR